MEYLIRRGRNIRTAHKLLVNEGTPVLSLISGTRKEAFMPGMREDIK